MDRKVKLYVRIARTVEALGNAKRSGNTLWAEVWREELATLAQEYLPHGSGFDSGTSIDLDRSRPDRLVFTTEYHHMDEHGFYDGWTEHDIIVTPSLAHGCVIHVAGPDRNGFRDYAHDTFSNALDAEVEAYPQREAPVAKPAA